jgi:Flp pilus assembly pilin Flp
VVAITHKPRLREQDAAGKPALSWLRHGFQVHPGKEVRDMINVKKPVFCTTRAAPIRRPKSSRGQTLVEYALIIAVISIVAIGVLINVGQQIKSTYTSIDAQVAEGQASH